MNQSSSVQGMVITPLCVLYRKTTTNILPPPWARRAIIRSGGGGGGGGGGAYAKHHGASGGGAGAMGEDVETEIFVRSSDKLAVHVGHGGGAGGQITENSLPKTIVYEWAYGAGGGGGGGGASFVTMNGKLIPHSHAAGGGGGSGAAGAGLDPRVYGAGGGAGGNGGFVSSNNPYGSGSGGGAGAPVIIQAPFNQLLQQLDKSLILCFPSGAGGGGGNDTQTGLSALGYHVDGEQSFMSGGYIPYKSYLIEKKQNNDIHGVCFTIDPNTSSDTKHGHVHDQQMTFTGFQALGGFGTADVTHTQRYNLTMGGCGGMNDCQLSHGTCGAEGASVPITTSLIPGLNTPTIGNAGIGGDGAIGGGGGGGACHCDASLSQLLLECMNAKKNVNHIEHVMGLYALGGKSGHSSRPHITCSSDGYHGNLKDMKCGCGGSGGSYNDFELNITEPASYKCANNFINGAGGVSVDVASNTSNASCAFAGSGGRGGTGNHPHLLPQPGFNGYVCIIFYP